MKKRFIFIGQGALSFALIFYLARMLDFERIKHLLTWIKLEYVGLAFLLLLISIFLSSIRWNTLLKQLNIIQGVLVSWRIYLVSMFYGIVLPGIIGGDVIRLAMAINQHGMKVKGLLAGSIIFERTCGFIAILMIFAAVAPFASYILGGEQFFSGTAYTVPVVILFISVLFFGVLRKLPDRWFSHQDGKQSIVHRLNMILNQFRSIPIDKLLLLIIISFLISFSDMVASYMLAKSLHMNISIYFFLLIIPVAYVLTALPISLGGLGVREGVLTFFLVKVGIMVSDAVLLAFLIYINRLAVSLLGGIIQLKRSNVVLSVKANKEGL